MSDFDKAKKENEKCLCLLIPKSLMLILTQMTKTCHSNHHEFKLVMTYCLLTILCLPGKVVACPISMATRHGPHGPGVQ